MNDLTKTCAALLIAALLVAAAALTRPSPITDARFSDQGDLFFPDFSDPTAPRSLEVLAFDPATASIKPFKVEFEKGRWVIPSHHGYPADARDNIAKAAAAFIGLRKERVVSDRAADHEALGVLDPDDPAAPLSGRGARVTLKDDKGALLADLIVGDTLAGEPDPATADPAGAPQRRYLRLAGKSRVYAASFPASFSTRFADWVETDLLKLESRRIDRLLVDRYEVDETKGEKRTLERLSLARITPAPIAATEPKWTLESHPGGPPAPGESLDNERIEESLHALGDLKIIGVRPKPPALAASLSGNPAELSQADLLDLQSRGFFLTRDAKFVANDGELIATADDGVVYNIAFGEVLLAEGDELSAGAENPAGKGDKPSDSTPAARESRYALLRVSFDPSLFPPLPSPPPTPPTNEPPPANGATNDPNASPPKDPAFAEYERLKAERDAKIAAGQARADILSRRFADWYFVIDAASFASLRPTRAQIIRHAPPPQPTPSPAATP